MLSPFEKYRLNT